MDCYNFESGVPATKGMQNNFYYGLMTSAHDTDTLTLIVFMLQIIQYGKNKILTLLLFTIVTKIHSFWSSMVQHSHRS